ncbi:hypothetical protein KFK09_004412 [Dendrobium nobile]|uniref:Zinc finger CCCH domain-containing protein 18-like n=1 Tax=Dendrobium nobile TaxID=94219 RepID=A0A8T3C0A0_DENNO|nr:hypothetical protein KFK09_004412 [Dendrobium nobile]
MAEFEAYKMNLSELTKIIIDRVQKLDPDNASKILGIILLNEPCEQEMIKLAFEPENALLSKIDEIKKLLGLSTKSPSISSQSQGALDQLLSTDQHPSLQNLGFVPQTYPDSIREGYSFGNQAQYLNLEEKMDSASSVGNYYYYQDGSFNGSSSSRTNRRSPSLPEFPIKHCYFFSKGYCKHGANCSYYHGQPFPDGSSQASCSNINELQCEENELSSGSLEKLEMEISDLLKSQRGAPVSISLLPLLYYEKYGRNLQADGYLTEGQRQGKPGFTLTKLLARFKNTIRLIDRPHGQHSVILAEDAPRYLECQPERGEPVATSTSTHRIYLTFPPDSTFTENDVFNYFNQFGPVKDVRIPRLEKRMYGFVSFLYPETVSEILMKRNLHYICGCRVLTKPYKDKPRMVDKTYMGKNKPSMHYPHQYLDLAFPRKTDSSRITELQLEEQQKMIELQRRRLASFNLVQEPLDQQPYFSYGLDDSKLLEGPSDFPFQDHLGLRRDVPNTGLSTNVKTRNTSYNYSDMESYHIELPENPFGSPP